MELAGKAAVVTGSSSVTGIGAECAQALAAAGCNVLINYVTNEDGAETTAALCAAHGVETLTFRADVTEDAACRAMIDAAVAKWGRLDVLVNNAATTKPVPQADLEGLDADEFLRIYDLNVIANFQMTRAAAPHLTATGDAAVVNVSSIGAFLGGGSSMAYAVSKGALNTMTISLARVLAPKVRVNAVCPGGLLGNWTSKILTPEGYQRRVQQAETDYPLGKAVWPTDVSNAVMWLISDATTLTGEIVRLDVGQHLK